MKLLATSVPRHTLQAILLAIVVNTLFLTITFSSGDVEEDEGEAERISFLFFALEVPGGVMLAAAVGGGD